MRIGKKWFWTVLVSGGLCVPGLAQPSRLFNAELRRPQSSGSLRQDFAAVLEGQQNAAWLGYESAAVGGERTLCCYYDGGNCLCRLEKNPGTGIQHTDDPVKLEGSDRLLILVRIENRQVGKVRAFSADCPIDAGGLPFIWLGNVKSTESVEFLTSFVDLDRSREVSRAALMAIAFHAGEAAQQLLESQASQPGHSPERETALFWLGNARGAEGFRFLDRFVREVGDTWVRRKAVFALYSSKQEGSIETLFSVASEDASGDVRGQALFWLAQAAGNRTVAALKNAIENDPEIEVKEQAVFGLSQLPADQGVPLLIEVARTHPRPRVRKRAMFWLGQSGDPRALRFFEEILLGKQ